MKLLSIIYGFIVYIRNKLYDYNILKIKKIENVEIICIGNVVVGGAGKTPAVQYFVNKYLKEGKNVGVLSRGYKGKRKKDPLLVRDNANIYANVIECGDEAYLHALNLKVPIVVSKNRYEGAKYLKENFNVEIIIMDDGFQHRKLYRNKDIVLIDATNPFGNFDYLPKGRLRESLHQLKRAHKIIISKSNYVNELDIKYIKNTLQKYVNTNTKKIELATFEKQYFYNCFEEIIPLTSIKNKNVLIFSSIANPKIFYETIKELEPQKIEQISFEDHYVYSETDIKNIENKSKNYDYILTTEKDIVKFKTKLNNLLILKMGFDIQNN